jgi:ribose/xylose/arabinose/galactoside ABC-type transport system permease subunit
MRTDRTDWVKFILDRFIWFIILGVFMFFSVKSENFLTPLNSINLLLHASVLGLMTIGQAICLKSGNFDLSAEGTLSLLAILAGWLMGSAGTGNNAVSRFESGSGWGVNPYFTLILILLLGTGIGWFNGFMITRLRMNNFIVTLAMQLVLRGLSLALCQGRNISGIPDSFRWLGMAKFGPIPVQLIFTAVFFIGFHFWTAAICGWGK